MKIIFTAMLLILSISVVNAQSNKTIKLKELGLSFQIPGGWSGGIEGDYYLLGHKTIPGLMVLSQNKSKTASELKNLALQGITDEGVQLSPKGDFKIVGDTRVEGFYEGIFNGSQVRVYSVGLINQFGSGINISIVTDIGKFTDVHMGEVEKLARSVKFTQRVESPGTNAWKQKIVGKQLKYLNVRSSSDARGQSDTRILKLYNDGTFYFYLSANTSIGDAVSRVRDEGDGTYRIYSVQDRAYLELTSNGNTVEYELSKSPENYTLLNGDRFAVSGIN